MDKMKGLAKGGWHPPGDKKITRENWKSDLKGMATGKKKDPFEEQRNHQSAPLTSLKDPDSFGPPPKHSAFYNANGASISRTGTASSSGTSSYTASNVGGPSGGWGSSVVETGYAQKKREQEEAERQRMEAEKVAAGPVPYRTDTTGLRTDNLPKPPLRRHSPAAGSPSLPPRGATRPVQAPPPPARQNAAPPPVLPPRQNEYPDEHTPAPPPPYNEALQQPQVPPQPQTHNPAQINLGAAQRLGQAGISVAGFGIGGNNNAAGQQEAQVRGPQPSQLNELQQRFARMNPGGGSEAAAPQSPISTLGGLAAAAHKKPAPPPPPKKSGLVANQQAPPSSSAGFQQGQAPPAPPIPTSSKPRPT